LVLLFEAFTYRGTSISVGLLQLVFIIVVFVIKNDRWAIYILHHLQSIQEVKSVFITNMA